MSKGITLKDDGTRQWSLFDGANPLKVTKPLRLIELFAGIGAQAKALENLGVKFEHYRICEFDKYAVASYNAIHGTEFTTSDITKIYAADLGIVETDKYEYIMTYSFPCTDLSKAGKQQGMSRESGTRSGLLWEVERLLKEAEELPQILLMENVPDVLSEKNSADFFAWCRFLEDLGYTNKYAILNAKDFGVPQNRERCFMLSWLGDFHYDFPQAKPLTVRLKDFLEPSVDEKYYLSEKTIKYFIQHTQESIEKGNGFRFEPIDGNVIGKTITTRAGSRPDDNFIKCEHIAQLEGSYEISNRVYSTEGLFPTITTMQGGGLEPKILEDFYKNRNPREYKEVAPTLRSEREGIIENCDVRLFQYGHGYLPFGEKNSDVFPTVRESNTARYNNAILQNGDNRIRKLTPKECWRLMGFDDESFSRAEKKVSNSQLYKQAGNSIVVDVLMAIFKNLF